VHPAASRNDSRILQYVSARILADLAASDRIVYLRELAIAFKF
jgi:hypothetical protein